MISLDLVNTVAAAGVVFLGGRAIQQRFPLLARYAVPPAVIGGLLVALVVAGLRASGGVAVSFDTALQAPLMIAFFTAVGFGASLPLLRSGGPAVALFLALATGVGLVQNVVGEGVARLLGAPALLGVVAGSLTLMGGPATGLAFAPLFERAGVPGAATLAVASATVGIVAGGILGGPIGSSLIERHRLRAAAPPDGPPAARPQADAAPRGGRVLLKGVLTILAAMAIGSWISSAISAAGLTLPAYIGAMLAAAALRGLDDAFGWLRLPHGLLEELGHAALVLFIAMALMTLRLWELAGLALPLATILAVQILLTAALSAWPAFRLMGRDYEAALMSAGFCGFMLGTTANAMANMDALRERHGPAPRAYFVVPMVGGFFVDFTNALLITAFLNLR